MSKDWFARDRWSALVVWKYYGKPIYNKKSDGWESAPGSILPTRLWWNEYPHIKGGQLWTKEEIREVVYDNHNNTPTDFVVEFAYGTPHQKFYRWTLVDTLSTTEPKTATQVLYEAHAYRFPADNHIRKIVNEELDKREEADNTFRQACANVMARFITYEKLKKAGACKEGLEWFKERFPSGMTYHGLLQTLVYTLSIPGSWYGWLRDREDELCT